MHDINLNNFCHVCGSFYEEPPWGEDGDLPSFDICECCGVEFGYEDATPEAAADYREKWIASGAPWFNKSKRPDNWDLPSQLARIGL